MLFPYLTQDDLMNRVKEARRRGVRPGYDNMTPQSAELWLRINGERLLRQLKEGRYDPSPVQGFFVAKKNGQCRTLVRTTVIDAAIQQCLLEYLNAEYDSSFSDHSYAYRPGRGVSPALEEFCKLGSAYRWCAKIDPVNCFGSIDFSALVRHLTDFLDDVPLTLLLMSFAEVPVIEDGEMVERRTGIPQGIPVGPFLCNVYLDCVDRWLEERGIPFVRYADDLTLFGNERGSLKETMEEVVSLLSEELRVRPNLKKCTLDAPSCISFLGHRFQIAKDGMLTLEADESPAAACHAWQSDPVKNTGHTTNLLSDGILRQKDYSLLLETDNALEHIPVKNTECINIFSNVVFDSGFLKKAAERGIVVNVFSQHGHLVGRFLPNQPLHAPAVTLTQLETYYDEQARVELAKQFVLGSLHNLRLVIRYYHRHRRRVAYAKALEEINGIESEIKEETVYENLLLLEANLRREYYQCFDLFTEGTGFVFEKRSRRPPRNPMNAMISFGNTVLYSYIATEINQTALDVRVGFLHATNRRMESLNLDVAELFRPLLVDRVVFKLINRKQLDPERHFTTFDNGAVYLNREGKRIFLEEFYDKLYSRLKVGKTTMTYAEIIREEVRKLVIRFRVGVPYKPFKQVK